FLLALLLDLLPYRLEHTCRFGARALQRFLLAREVREAFLELVEAERFTLRALAILLLRQAVTLRRQLLEPSLLHLRGALGIREIASDPLPALAPLLHCGLGLP